MKKYSDKIIILPEEENRLIMVTKSTKFIQVVYQWQPLLVITLDIPLHWGILYHFCECKSLPIEQNYPAPGNPKDLVLPPKTKEYALIGAGRIRPTEESFEVYDRSMHYQIGPHLNHLKQVNKDLKENKILH